MRSSSRRQASSPSRTQQMTPVSLGTVDQGPLQDTDLAAASTPPEPPSSTQVPQQSSPNLQPATARLQQSFPPPNISQAASASSPTVLANPGPIPPKSSWLLDLPSAPHPIQTAPTPPSGSSLPPQSPHIQAQVANPAAADPHTAWLESIGSLLPEMDNSFVPVSFIQSLTPSPTAAGLYAAHAAMLGSALLPSASLGPAQFSGFSGTQLNSQAAAHDGPDLQGFAMHFPEPAATPEAPSNRLKRILPGTSSFGSQPQQPGRIAGPPVTPRTARAARYFHSYVHTVKTDELGRWSLW